MGFDDFLNGASGLAIGGYLIAVVYQGNTKELGKQLWGEEHYLEFLTALILLATLHQYGPTSKISTMLLAASIIGLVMRIGHNINLNSTLSDFASGKESMLDTAKKLIAGLDFGTPIKHSTNTPNENTPTG